MTRNETFTLLAGVGIGAALMYVLDPDRGRRRRALARDQLTGATNKAGMYLGKFSRDTRNRAVGLVAEARTRFRREDVTDDVLVDRVRAELGRHSVHQRALQITSDGGRVTLAGAALASEVVEIIEAVSSVRGVVEVDNRLDVHEEADGIPALQGEVARAARA